jgi:ribosomal protein S18 acetylase RimI-like enzyme
MTDPYSYRKARSDERAQIFQLYRTVMRSYIEEIWGWDEQWQENDFREHFEPDQITVALVGGKLVGYAQAEPQSEAFYIRMLLLATEYRRQGIGARLLQVVLSAASEQHLGVKLQVFKINESAKRFYECHGFRVVGETSTSLEMEFDA